MNKILQWRFLQGIWVKPPAGLTRIQEGDEGEGAEGFRDEDVRDFTILLEIGAEVVSCDVLCGATHEHLPTEERVEALL